MKFSEVIDFYENGPPPKCIDFPRVDPPFLAGRPRKSQKSMKIDGFHDFQIFLLNFAIFRENGLILGKSRNIAKYIGNDNVFRCLGGDLRRNLLNFIKFSIFQQKSRNSSNFSTFYWSPAQKYLFSLETVARLWKARISNEIHIILQQFMWNHVILWNFMKFSIFPPQCRIPTWLHAFLGILGAHFSRNQEIIEFH